MYSLIMDHYNTSSLNQAAVEFDYLGNLQAVQTMIKKPEYLFLSRYYYLLQKCIIPNHRITLPILHQYYDINRNVEDFILNAISTKECVQRLLNFLLVKLDIEKDYMKFCVVINSISVMTNLSYRMIAEFRTNGHWKHVQVHPKLVPCKSQPHQHLEIKRLCAKNASDVIHVTPAIDQPTDSIPDCHDKHKASYPSDAEIDNVLCEADNQHGLIYVEFQGATSAIHISNKRRNVSVLTSKKRLQISAIQERFSNLVELLPTNCYSTVCKLRKMTNFTDVDDKMSGTLSECDDARVINNQLLSYIINKCAGNIAFLCDVLLNVVSSDKKDHLLNLVSSILPSLNTAADAHSSFHCTIPAVAPVVHIAHQENEHRIVSTNFASTSEDHCVITTDTSLNITQPNDTSYIAPNTSTESTMTADKLLIVTSVDMLCSQNILTYNEAVEICLANNQAKMKILDDKLAAMSPEFKSGTIADLGERNIATECDIPQCIELSTDFSLLKSKYKDILKCLPQDFHKSLQKLQDKLSDDQICTILGCTSSQIANNMILDCLIDKLKCREDMLDLCDQLDRLSDSAPDLKQHINELMKDVAQDLEKEICLNTRKADKDVTDNRDELQTRIQYNEGRSQRGFKYLQPPPLPSYHVTRQDLLDEIATKLLQSTNDPNKYETTVTITGAGGFGKTTLVTSLCYHPVVKEHFSDGFVFIELGPQATDPSIKLSQLYHLLTGEYLKQCDIVHAEQELKQFTSDFYHNLLVIIDDVWHVEDAEPILKAFSNCKTILTTRMNDIEQCIPANQTVTVGPMSTNEAISLLTSKITESSQLSQEDVRLLDKLAQDVHLWPLLLSLIRGQLSHNLKQYHLSYHEAIKTVQSQLHHRGLTAFDKNNINSRKLAVKVCIEITLELLTKSISDKIKTLVLYTGIGTSVQTAILDTLWKISKQEAENTIDVLWAYGLVHFTHIIMPPNNSKQHCVEVHAVISQFITESLDINEFLALSPFFCKNLNSGRVVEKALTLNFMQASYGMLNQSDALLLMPVEFLKFYQSLIENVNLTCYLKYINMYTVSDPYIIIYILQQIKDGLLIVSSPIINIFSLFIEEIDSLLSECKQVLKHAHILCRKFNQGVQRNLLAKNYEMLIQIMEDFIKNYPLGNIILKAITMMNKIVLCCKPVHKLEDFMVTRHEALKTRTNDNHYINTALLPLVKLYIKVHKDISFSLMAGAPYIEKTYCYITNNTFDEEIMLLQSNYFIKMQEFAPNVAYLQAKNSGYTM